MRMPPQNKLAPSILISNLTVCCKVWCLKKPTHLIHLWQIKNSRFFVVFNCIFLLNEASKLWRVILSSLLCLDAETIFLVDIAKSLLWVSIKSSFVLGNIISTTVQLVLRPIHLEIIRYISRLQLTNLILFNL